MLYEALLNDSAEYRTVDPKPAVRVLVQAQDLAVAAKKLDAWRDENRPGWAVSGLGECRDLVLVS